MGHAYAQWLSGRSQPVLYTACWASHESPLVVSPELKDTPITHIFNPGWAYSAAGLRRAADQLRTLLPRWRHLVVYGQRRVVADAADADCHYVHPHVMLNDSVHEIIDTEKYYDAVLMARAVPWKRHKLAKEVPKLLCIAADFGDANYDREMKTDLPSAYFVPSVSSDQWITSGECVGYYVQARSGLMLSACEGECRAFGEYQLCGLPVVTTAANGGRAETADPEFMRIVAPCPTAVAAAVRDVIDQQYDPQQVRLAFRTCINEHRHRLEGVLGHPVDWSVVPGCLPWVDMCNLKLPEQA